MGVARTEGHDDIAGQGMAVDGGYGSRVIFDKVQVEGGIIKSCGKMPAVYGAVGCAAGIVNRQEEKMVIRATGAAEHFSQFW